MFLKVPKFWYSKSQINPILRCCLTPISRVYRFFAVRNLRKRHRYKAQYAKVIAIGGLTVGGSGKTPVVASICSLFKDSRHRIAILSRGFGRDSDKALHVNALWHSFREVGDEPLMLARYADVFVAKNRMNGAEEAEGMGHDLIIMDDGLTQRDLQPNVRIVVIDSAQGLGNGELLPLGPNRVDFEMLQEGCGIPENSIGAVTAKGTVDDGSLTDRGLDAVAIIKSCKSDEISPIISKIPKGIAIFSGYLQEDFSQIKTQDLSHPERQRLAKILEKKKTKKKRKKKIVFREAVSIESDLDTDLDLESTFKDYSDKELHSDFDENSDQESSRNTFSNPNMAEQKFLAFCGIGYPQKFFNSLKKKLKVIKEVEFPDHYPYSDDEIIDLLDEARLLGASLITTEKDLCRISKQYHNFISVVPVKVVWENPRDLAEFLELQSLKMIGDREWELREDSGRSEGNVTSESINIDFKRNRNIKLFMASDHAGFQLKSYLQNEIPKYFRNIDIVDLGTKSEESCDYPLYAHELAKAMNQEENRKAKCIPTESITRGVLICGTGIGMSIAANRYPKIRAALCDSDGLAVMARRHNDANVLVLGARFIEADEVALRRLICFLETEFDGGRHEGRVRMLDDIC